MSRHCWSQQSVTLSPSSVQPLPSNQAEVSAMYCAAHSYTMYDPWQLFMCKTAAGWHDPLCALRAAGLPPARPSA